MHRSVSKKSTLIFIKNNSFENSQRICGRIFQHFGHVCFVLSCDVFVKCKLLMAIIYITVEIIFTIYIYILVCNFPSLPNSCPFLSSPSIYVRPSHTHYSHVLLFFLIIIILPSLSSLFLSLSHVFSSSVNLKWKTFFFLFI